MTCVICNNPLSDGYCSKCRGKTNDFFRTPEQSASAPVESLAAGSVSSDNEMSEGVWFKSTVSGGLYRNHKAAGDIECIFVDGVWFDRSE